MTRQHRRPLPGDPPRRPRPLPARPHPDPPDDQFVVRLPCRADDTLREVSLVGHSRESATRWLLTKFGDGRMQNTRQAGVYRWHRTKGIQ